MSTNRETKNAIENLSLLRVQCSRTATTTCLEPEVALPVPPGLPGVYRGMQLAKGQRDGPSPSGYPAGNKGTHNVGRACHSRTTTSAALYRLWSRPCYAAKKRCPDAVVRNQPRNMWSSGVRNVDLG